MSRLRPGFVLGYHGCDAETAAAIIGGGSMRQSDEDFDWLGPGVYFWESDPQRAYEWADAKVARGAYARAAVVGAVIDLGNCLDLTTRVDLALMADAYASFVRAQQIADLALPQNRDPRGLAGDDKVLRYLDCAVIKHLHQNIEDDAREHHLRGESPPISPFDSVRGLFVEGGQLYPVRGAHRGSGALSILPRTLHDLGQFLGEGVRHLPHDVFGRFPFDKRPQLVLLGRERV